MRIAPLLSLLSSIAVPISLFCTATPLHPSSSNLSLSLDDIRDTAVCTPPTGRPVPDTYKAECVHAARDFYHVMNVYAPRHWKRPPVPAGYYNPLPYSVAPEGCRITLDVLDDPGAVDVFSLKSTGREFAALMLKCVVEVERGGSGYIPVGPRKVMKVTIGPATVGGGAGSGRLVGGGGNGTVDHRGVTDFL